MDVLRHMVEERGLQPERYRVFADDETATFLLYNLSGQIVGYQRYRPGASKEGRNDEAFRYFTHRTDTMHHGNRRTLAIAAWGLESFAYRDDVLFLVEGIFDAVKLHNLGLPAIAVLANDPKHLAGWLRLLPRRLIVVADPDEGGAKLREFGDVAITAEPHHDLGEMTTDQVRLLLAARLPWLEF